MAQRRDYAREYAQRTRGLEKGTEAYQAARGHRGQRDLESAIRSKNTDSITWTWSGTKGHVIVTSKTGDSRAYTVRRGTRKQTGRVVQAARRRGVPVEFYSSPKARRRR